MEKLQYGKFYHIYTHGVGYRNVVKDAENYEHFLGLYAQYIDPIADTYAWVLMPNHVHFVVRVKTEEEVANFNSDRVLNPVRVKNQRPLKIGTPSIQFSKLFNSYAQAFNRWIEAKGSLFERPFQRKRIKNLTYLKKTILYVHSNPVHHGFCEDPVEYPWSSYRTCISLKPTKLKREKVIGWFDSEANFKTKHGEVFDLRKLEKWLGVGISYP